MLSSIFELHQVIQRVIGQHKREIKLRVSFFQAVLLLCAVWVLCSDGVGVQSQACVSNREVKAARIVTKFYLNR